MRYFHGLLLVFLTLAVNSGCTTGKRDSAAAVSNASASAESSQKKPSQEESAETLLRGRLASRSREVGRLRLQLLAKQAEINQLLISHERALQEAARANTKLRGFDSRADTVATIAEATLTINNARETAGEEQQPALIHAEKLLERSRQEMQTGNLDAAYYLATKALSLAQLPAAAPDYGSGIQTGETEILFALPIAMIVKKQSNVRKLPMITSKPLFQLAAGVKIKALAYNDLWVRIVTEEEREGWIYYYLLETIDPDT